MFRKKLKTVRLYTRRERAADLENQSRLAFRNACWNLKHMVWPAGALIGSIKVARPAEDWYEKSIYEPLDTRLEEYRAPDVVTFARECGPREARTLMGVSFDSSSWHQTGKAEGLARQAAHLPSAMLAAGGASLVCALLFAAAVKGFRKSRILSRESSHLEFDKPAMSEFGSPQIGIN
jgi:hypothetical protein